MTLYCGKYLGDNDGTCPQLTCIRASGHPGLCDNVRGDDEVVSHDARPSYVHCVLTGMFDRPEKRICETWCGRKNVSMEFTYMDAGHASLLARSGTRLMVCPTCAHEIVKALKAATWEP